MRLIPFLTLLSCTSDNLDVDAPSDSLDERITSEGLFAHLEALQAIADAHDGHRAVGSTGYAASVDYVVEVLETAGYAVQRTPFTARLWQQYGPTVAEVQGGTSFVAGEEVAALRGSPGGDVTAPLAAVDLTLPPGNDSSSTSGCETEDFVDFPAGHIALIQRGGCFFQTKAELAEAAGASAVLVFNEGQPGRTELEGWQLDSDQPLAIPVVGANFATGSTLADGLAAGELILRLVVDAERVEVQSENVLADTPGDASKTVVVGGHLDSVPEGPGINDNGTGVALMLELARLMAGDQPPENRVRFAFWGAEEIGLVGSLDYLQNAEEAELDGFVANLNFDMIGSPNGSPFIYDGDGDDWGQAGPEGSGVVEDLFEAWFDQQGKRSLSTPLDGRSDYGGFLMLGIPAGGLFSGAEGTKEFDEAGAFGGVAGEPRDPCYHRACDTIDNIDPALFLDLSRAAAFATEQLARGQATLPPRSPSAARRLPTTHIGACGHPADERQ